MGKDQIGLRRAMMGLLFLLTVELAEAHPAHAKPVNYPFVVGFERFHSGMDDDDYLAEGGFILLNELNCVACHAPPTPLADQLEGTTATHLGGVGTRLDPINLEMMIRNPRFLKRDSIMPSLFAGPDRDLEEVKAIKQYLASLTEAIPTYPVGDIEVGRSLYHRIGCVACHAPELGYRPIGLPENAAIELTGLPSVPMNLADIYDLNSLTHFLLHPNEHRPSGRMPDFKLNEKEDARIPTHPGGGGRSRCLSEGRARSFTSCQSHKGAVSGRQSPTGRFSQGEREGTVCLKELFRLSYSPGTGRGEDASPRSAVAEFKDRWPAWLLLGSPSRGTDSLLWIG